LATAVLALIILFAIVSMTIAVDVLQSTSWTKKVVHVSDSFNGIRRLH
jgi:hypothetical protein